MALTNDDKNEILEQYGKGYSHRKIADKTGHSETTIRKEIKIARQRVGPLFAQSLAARQIAKQTAYPIEFISRLKEMGTGEPDVKEMIQPEDEKAKQAIVIEDEWNTFLKTQDVESLRIRLRRRIKNHIGRIGQLESRLEKENLNGSDWADRKQVILGRFDFISERSLSASEEKEIQDLDRLIDKVVKEVSTLMREYETKLNQLNDERARQRRKVSDDLLDERLFSPMFPEDVKRQIKELILVQNESQARTVCLAFFQRAMPILEASKENTPVADEFWESFVRDTRNRGWSFIKEMAQVSLECYGDLTRFED